MPGNSICTFCTWPCEEPSGKRYEWTLPTINQSNGLIIRDVLSSRAGGVVYMPCKMFPEADLVVKAAIKVPLVDTADWSCSRIRSIIYGFPVVINFLQLCVVRE